MLRFAAMSEATIEQLYAMALEHYRASRLSESAALLDQIIRLQPSHLHALSLRGAIAHRLGRADEAIEFLRRALTINPGSANLHIKLGLVLLSSNRLEEAIKAFRQAILLDPQNAEAHNNLGAALFNARELGAAIQAYRIAIALRPRYREAMLNLADALRLMDECSESISNYQKILEQWPDLPDALLGIANAYRDAGQFDPAIASYQRAIDLQPGNAQAYAHLGMAYQLSLRIDEAMAAYRKALELQPSLVPAWINLGQALVDTAELDAAIQCFRRAESISGEVPSNLLFAVHLHSDYDAERIFAEHVRWSRRQARVPQFNSYLNIVDPDRRLRIGYHSPNLRNHPVGRFLLPLLEQRNCSSFEIFCYSDVRNPDLITSRIRGHCDVWRDTPALSDQGLAQCVHEDCIDIFVDLTLHGEGTRLPAFARKPAPVQATYLAYCSTSGLESIDYRFTDSFLDPDDANARWYSERSVRLRSYWCYQPDRAAPDIGPLPARSRGILTFGNLNSFQKVTAPALDAWAQILKRVPNSRLMLHALEGQHRQRVGDLFSSRGVDPGRLEFVGYQPIERYFSSYANIDIALDPFPYPGGTTTCDALWMGVPVITLTGNTAVSRGGCSILNQVGKPEWITHSTDEYVQRAASIAGDLDALESHRTSLRERMHHSPLMNAEAFARNVEDAYRKMWRDWCEKKMG